MPHSTYLTAPTILSALSLLCRLFLCTHSYPVSTEQLTQFHSGARLPRSRGIFQNHCKCSSGFILHLSDCPPCKTGCAGIGHTLLENGSGLCEVFQDSCSSLSTSFFSLYTYSIKNEVAKYWLPSENMLYIMIIAIPLTF